MPYFQIYLVWIPALEMAVMVLEITQHTMEQILLQAEVGQAVDPGQAQALVQAQVPEVAQVPAEDPVADLAEDQVVVQSTHLHKSVQ